jgi:hypothetical protein
MIRTYKSLRRRPALEGLESRALLTTLAHTPAALSPAAVHILQDNAQAGQGGDLGNNGGKGPNAGLGQGGFAGGGSLASQLGLTNAHLSYRNPGNGHLNYVLRFDSGGYRFRQTYQLDVNRARGNDGGFANGNGAPFGMLDALNLSLAGISQHLFGGGGNGGNGNGGGNGDAHSSQTDAYGGTWSHNGGNKYQYQQQYTVGGYRFNARYKFELNRVHGRNNGGNPAYVGLTALDAADLFLTSLQQRVYGGLNAGGSGGTGGLDDGSGSGMNG